MVVFYAVARVDKMFIVPNGASGPGDYSRPVESVEEGKDAGLRDASGEEGAQTAPEATAPSGNETTPAPPTGLDEKTEAESEDQAVQSQEPVVQRNGVEETKTTTEPGASTEAA